MVSGTDKAIASMRSTDVAVLGGSYEENCVAAMRLECPHRQLNLNVILSLLKPLALCY